jgi:hypothetical protein
VGFFSSGATTKRVVEEPNCKTKKVVSFFFCFPCQLVVDDEHWANEGAVSPGDRTGGVGVDGRKSKKRKKKET